MSSRRRTESRSLASPARSSPVSAETAGRSTGRTISWRAAKRSRSRSAARSCARPSAHSRPPISRISDWSGSAKTRDGSSAVRTPPATPMFSISIRRRCSTAGWRWGWRCWCWARNRDRLHRPDLDPRVVVRQDLLRRPAARGHTVRADLAEADTVSPSLAVEGVAIHAVGVLRLLVDEEIVRHVERPAHGQAFQNEGPAPFGGHLQLGDALRGIDRQRTDALQLPDGIALVDGDDQVVRTETARPAGEAGAAIERRAVEVGIDDQRHRRPAALRGDRGAIANRHWRVAVLLIAIIDFAEDGSAGRQREARRLAVDLQRHLAAGYGQDLSGRITDHAVFANPRSEESVKFLARHGRVHIDPIDLLGRQKSELDEKRRGAVRRRFLARRLREVVVAILR